MSIASLFTDPAQRIAQQELNRFQSLRASGDPNAPAEFDADGIVQLHNIETSAWDHRAAAVAGATQGIYDKLSPLPDSGIPMAALLRATFTVLAPGLSPACSPAIAAAKVGATALLQQDIPLDDTFRDYIGLGAVHAVQDLSSQEGTIAGSQRASEAQAALNQYNVDAAVPGQAHLAAINLVNFLSAKAQEA